MKKELIIGIVLMLVLIGVLSGSVWVVIGFISGMGFMFGIGLYRYVLRNEKKIMWDKLHCHLNDKDEWVR